MKTPLTTAVAVSLFAVSALVPSGGVPANGASAAPAPPAGGITYVAGSTRKICQVTGEMDRSFRPPKPTVNQTATRYGLVAADLGYSFYTMATWNPYAQVIMTTEIQGSH
ncbi:MAG TPA: hypothetical protein VK587_13595 [bacterium]|nr:hypothetical protein [bacterium]